MQSCWALTVYIVTSCAAHCIKCYTMLHYVTLCHTVTQCYSVILCYTMLHCYIMLHNVTLCYIMLHNVTLLYYVHNVTLCYTVLHNVTQSSQCYSMWSYAHPVGAALIEEVVTLCFAWEVEGLKETVWSTLDQLVENVEVSFSCLLFYYTGL